jgi:selenocysteine lyase/cysteine desulfurase
MTATPNQHNLIHLNNAAASLTLPGVFQEMRAYMDKEAALASTEAMIATAAPLAAIYDDVAALVGAPTRNLACFSSNTEACQKAFLALTLKPGHQILVAQTEGGNLSALKHRCDRVGRHD